MNGLQKGLRLEDSVSVFVGPKISLLSAIVEPAQIQLGKAVKITYEIECAEPITVGAWLGASFSDNTTQKFHSQPSEDKAVPLIKGRNICHRIFTIPSDASLGQQMLRTN